MSEIADKLIDNFNTASRDVQKVRSTSNLELFMDAWNSLSGYIEELESRIAELSQAVGLITTLKPTMVMDANHPLDMVREVAEHVTARIAELEAECEQLRRGIHDETVPEKYEENVAKLQKEFSMRFENESPVEFYRTIRSGQYPQPPEVQE